MMKEPKTYNLTPHFIKICRTVCMVMASFAIMFVVLDAIFFFRSHCQQMILINGVGVLSSMVFLFIFVRTMLHKQLIKKKSVINALSLTTFLFLLLAVAPILTYLMLGDQWIMVSEFGLTKLVVNSLDIYYRAAIFTLLLTVITYWLMVAFTKRESSLYKMLNKKKIEIYEKDKLASKVSMEHSRC